ncbi:MAG TPA: DUF4760 domain-containing protein [Acidimicrobiales bacterium]|jgi:hypothetical protein
MAATYEDAQLVVQLMRWDAESGVDDALAVLFSDAFDPETASLDDANVRKVLTFGETVGALVRHNVLDRALILDVYWFAGIWERVKHHALMAREDSHEPTLYENFEMLVSRSQR